MFGSKLSLFLAILWLVLLVFLFCPPRDPPPSAPSGVGLARGFPVYAHPAPLSARVGQHSGLVSAEDCYRELGEEPPLSYTERFSPEAIGSDWAWAEAACEGCPIATAAVREQGIGE